jgi:hypothetical protein
VSAAERGSCGPLNATEPRTEGSTRVSAQPGAPHVGRALPREFDTFVALFSCNISGWGFLKFRRPDRAMGPIPLREPPPGPFSPWFSALALALGGERAQSACGDGAPPWRWGPTTGLGETGPGPVRRVPASAVRYQFSALPLPRIAACDGAAGRGRRDAGRSPPRRGMAWGAPWHTRARARGGWTQEGVSRGALRLSSCGART